MKARILVAALACLSVTAAAQSEKKTDQTASHEIKSPRDLASGQATGRKANQADQQSSQPATARETGSGMATGKKTEVSGDPHVQEVSNNGDQTAVRESPTKASQTKVATGDVDGDGKMDRTSSSSEVKAPRDAATGQASGKRQHQPLKMEAPTPKN